MEDVIHAVHGVFDGLQIPHVADVEADFVRHLRHGGLEVVAHVVLLLFVAAEDADFADVGGEEAVEDRVAEGTGAAGEH